MQMCELDYHLPPGAIALRPAEPRDHSRLMVVKRSDATPLSQPEHRHFFDLPGYLRPGDLLITNNTRVIPAKLLLHKPTGGRIPGLFVSEMAPGLWQVMLRTRGRASAGDRLLTAPSAEAYCVTLEARLGEGLWQVRVEPPDAASRVLERIGAMPIPPYIEKARREHEGPAATAREPWQEEDRAWYQTVYADTDGNTGSQSVAAPTAGLHFTPELLDKIRGMGVEHAHVELDVGLGTFLPVETQTFEEHPMHTEHYRVPAETVAAIRRARGEGRRLVVVGTTAVRTLESAAGSILDLSALPPTELSGNTDLKIAPGYRFQLTDALVTNFHLPKSTLMALVSAYLEPGGVARLKALYGIAVEEGYRFYSYGDAMFLG